ncbi:MAG: Maf family protein [bacterium]|nr:Maf family protein [bacterium]
MKIIFGSSSKYRRAVLEKHGYQFEVMSPDIDEKAIRTDDYYQLPLLLAYAKARALISLISEPAIVITADQVVVCNGDLHEKPQSSEEAKIFLQKYSNGHPAETVAALVVTNLENGKQTAGVDIAKVHYNFIPESVMDDFIKNGDPFTKAGGFAIQSSILQPYMQKVEGTEDSIMGMPIKLLEKLLAEVQ